MTALQWFLAMIHWPFWPRWRKPTQAERDEFGLPPDKDK